MLKRGKNENSKSNNILKDCTSNIQENFYERETDKQTDRETLKNLSDFPFRIR